jgi:putative transcriptional regulator
MSEVIYNRIAVLRAERGTSRRQLADALGVHYQTIGYLERGEYNPSLHLAMRIAQYFEVPVEVVFSTDPFPRIGGAARPSGCPIKLHRPRSVRYRPGGVR